MIQTENMLQNEKKTDYIMKAKTKTPPTTTIKAMMTTVTTVLGLTPLALGIGAGADLRAPLAIAVIGGLLSATLLTLIVVPVMYASLDGLRGLIGSRAAPATVSGD